MKSFSRSTAVQKRLHEFDHHLASLQRQKQRGRWVWRAEAHTFFALVIVANAVFIGVDAQLEHKPHGQKWEVQNLMWVIDCIFATIFLVEVALRLEADGMYGFWKSGWNCFDLVISLLGAIDCFTVRISLDSGSDSTSALSSIVVLRVVRLLRLVRVLRLLEAFHELSLLVQVLIDSVIAVWYASLLMFIVIYVGGVFCTAVFIGQDANESTNGAICNDSGNCVCIAGFYGKDCSQSVYEAFGSVPQAMYAHFRIMVIDGWNDIAQATSDRYGWAWQLYFIVFVALAIALKSMVCGLVTLKMLTLGDNDPTPENLERYEELLRLVIESLFYNAGRDPYGELDVDDIYWFFHDQYNQQIMQHMGVKQGLPWSKLWRLFAAADAETGFVEFHELYNICHRLGRSHGSQSRKLIILQSDVRRGLHQVRGMLQTVGKSIVDIDHFEGKQVKHFEKLVGQTGSSEPQHIPSEEKPRNNLLDAEQQSVIEHLGQGQAVLEINEEQPYPWVRGSSSDKHPSSECEQQEGNEATVKAVDNSCCTVTCTCHDSTMVNEIR